MREKTKPACLEMAMQPGKLKWDGGIGEHCQRLGDLQTQVRDGIRLGDGTLQFLGDQKECILKSIAEFQSMVMWLVAEMGFEP